MMSGRAYSIIIALIVSLLRLDAANIEIGKPQVDAILVSLDDSLALSGHHINARQAEIDLLTDSLRRNGLSDSLLLRISDRYTSFNNDSAMHYIRLGLESDAVSRKLPFRLRQSMLLPLSGFMATAIDIFSSIPEDSVPADMKADYYDAGRQMYSYISAFSARDPEYSGRMFRRALEYQENLLKYLPAGSKEYKFNLGEYYFYQGERGKARAILEEVVRELPADSNLRARAAHHLSAIASSAGDADGYTYYLAMSALADAATATREVASLQELGNHLYSLGDVNRAYDYLNRALANAVECGAPMRMIESVNSLPIIERAKTEQINDKQRTIFTIMAVMALLVVGLVIMIFLLRREMRNMQRLQEKLRAANTTKEVYISQFLNLCSIYMDKLNQFCKIANRKIAAGKVDELFRLTKSGKFIEEQSAEFYQTFDNAFLHLYPDFVSKVNALLRPDAQIELREGEKLNTDLRILAFMRLGIEESSRIAQVLNYSLNTIYAYRNRTKGRAINRDTFEQDVMKIPSDI